MFASFILAGCGSSDQSTSPTPEPRLPFLIAQQVGNPMVHALAIRDGDCVGSADVDIVLPDLGPVDSAILLRAGAHGLYEARQLTVFFGPVEEASAAFGGTALFAGPQETWIRTGPGTARALVAFATPAGREVWILLHTAQVTECGLR